jgi:catalase
MPLPEASDSFAPVRDDLPPTSAVSILANPPGTFHGRKLGLLVTNGSDASVVGALVDAVKAAGGIVFVVAPKAAGVTLSDGTPLAADGSLAGSPSVLFDAVAVIPSEVEAGALAQEPTAKDFVTDAFHHFKFLGHGPHARRLLEKAGLLDRLDSGCLEVSVESAGDFVTHCAALRKWDRAILG